MAAARQCPPAPTFTTSERCAWHCSSHSVHLAGVQSHHACLFVNFTGRTRAARWPHPIWRQGPGGERRRGVVTCPLQRPAALALLAFLIPSPHHQINGEDTSIMTNQQVVTRLTKSGSSVRLRLSRYGPPSRHAHATPVQWRRPRPPSQCVPPSTTPRSEPVFLQYLAQNGIESQVVADAHDDAASSKSSLFSRASDESEEDRRVRFGAKQRPGRTACSVRLPPSTFSMTFSSDSRSFYTCRRLLSAKSQRPPFRRDG